MALMFKAQGHVADGPGDQVKENKSSSLDFTTMLLYSDWA